MYQKEEIINLWFKMWIYKKDLGMENIFSQNIKYIESYGVKYENLLEVKRWFHEWNKKNTVLSWEIKDFWHKDNETMVVWYFKCLFEGKVDEFEGNSIVHWNENFKIDYLKEFACKLPQTNPYR